MATEGSGLQDMAAALQDEGANRPTQAEVAAAKKAEVIVLPADGPLVRFAIEELKRAGLHQADADYGGALAAAVVELVRVFSRQRHSGGSAHSVLQIFGEMARFRPLGPLTDDPAEWNDVAEFSAEPGIWQSRRRPDAFSRDGGKTYYLLDEPWPRWRRWLGLERKNHASAPARRAA